MRNGERGIPKSRIQVRDMDPAVDVRGLTKVYEGKFKALDGVDLTVEKGKVFALLGPNGAGKTTLIRILTTQFTPTSGEAYVFGKNVVHDGSEVRKIVSYVPQEMGVWTDISGYENLLIYAKIYGIPSQERKKIILDALEKIGLTDFANSLVSTYSGGMIRRLEIVSALLIKPVLLFLDEPTIGLDPSARKIVWEELTSFKEEYGATVFFNTHYMDEADLYSDEIGIINRGKIVAMGTPAQLKHSVGGDVIRLDVEGEVISEGIMNKLRSLSLVSQVAVQDSELNIVVRDSETALPVIVETLRKQRVSVRKISMTKPTLDDVFLKYAGTRLEPSGRVSEVRQARAMIKRG